jgi:hypothetical protein
VGYRKILKATYRDANASDKPLLPVAYRRGRVGRWQPATNYITAPTLTIIDGSYEYGPVRLKQQFIANSTVLVARPGAHILMFLLNFLSSSV